MMRLFQDLLHLAVVRLPPGHIALFKRWKVNDLRTRARHLNNELSKFLYRHQLVIPDVDHVVLQKPVLKNRFANLHGIVHIQNQLLLPSH